MRTADEEISINSADVKNGEEGKSENMEIIHANHDNNGKVKRAFGEFLIVVRKMFQSCCGESFRFTAGGKKLLRLCC